MSSDSRKPDPPFNAQQLLEELLRSGLIDPRALDLLPDKSRGELKKIGQTDRLLVRLADLKLLTSYQVGRISNGKIHGLILGKYRILDRLGVGGDGVVFRANHRETGAQVAIKVLIPARDQDPKPMLRFFAERKAVAQLSHPSIVRALDVGEESSGNPDEPVLYYYVMEHVPGFDLEKHIRKHGPMQPNLACEVAHQVADALTEAHKHDLVHRDIKPANILLTPEGRALLVDFGVVRRISSRQTEPGSLVGILEWIAPEQARDAHTVDIRADIYSLGCTLFWCLTARSPYGVKGPLTNLASIQATPSVRSIRETLAPELDAVVARMMAPLPDDRYPTPHAVMEALIPFVSEQYAQIANIALAAASPPPPPAPSPVSSLARILIVGADPALRCACREALQAEGIVCDESGDGESALQAVAAAMPDLVLLDVDMPGMTGFEVLKRLHQNPRWDDQKIIMLTASDTDIRQLLAAGADDYLPKPIEPVQLRAHVKTALRLKLGSGQKPPYGDEIGDRPDQPKATALWQRVINWLPGRRALPRR
jgi:putative two-component system response regulator